MTPHRDRKRGTFIIDRRIKGVGRIKLASGTDHAPTFRRLNEMLDGLVSRGRLDIVRAIRDQQLTPLTVFAAYRVNELDTLPTPDMLVGLSEALDAFVKGYEGAPHHAANMKSAAKHITSEAGQSATVDGLVAAVRALRVSMKATPRMFNVVKATAQAFARDRYGKASRVWLELAGIQQLKVKVRVSKHPVTPAELRAVMAKMPVTEGLMAWTLACTGMRPKEYWGDWDVCSSYVHVHGTKTAGADRKIPHPSDMLVKPQCWYGKFRASLGRASGEQMTPYDLRRSYANWLEDAGIPRTRRRLYIGHGAKDTTDLYEWRELKAHLEADGKTLAAWIAKQIAAPSHANSHVKVMK